jgi:hypothetical protein
MAKFELFFSVDAEGNRAVRLEDAETAHEAYAEYDAGSVRTVCLSVDMDLPTDQADEDEVTVVDVPVPPQEEEPAEQAEAEEPAEKQAKEEELAACVYRKPRPG